MIRRTISPGGSPSCTAATTCSVIGMSTSCARASARIDSAGLHALGGLPGRRARPRRGVMPRPRFSPKVRLRDSGDMQVATRSPTPASPAKVAASAPERQPEPGDLGEPAGDDRGLRVVAHAHALGHADGQRDDVLHRAAELDADHVGVRVGPEVRRRGRPAAASRRLPSSAQATTLAAGCRWAISLARLGPDTTAMRSGPAPVTSAMTSLIRRVVPSSMPFIRLTRTQSGGRSATHALEVAAQRLRRHREHDDLGAVAAPRAGSCGRADRSRAAGCPGR